jgi:hypothetical protein
VGRQTAALAAAVGIVTALATVGILVIVVIVIVIVLGLNIHNYYSILNKTYFILKHTNFLSNEPENRPNCYWFADFFPPDFLDFYPACFVDF